MKLLYVACAAVVVFAACADRDPLSSTADPSIAYKAGKPTVSSESVAGLPEPRVPAHFTVRIENIGTVLAPGAWVAQRGGTPLFIRRPARSRRWTRSTRRGRQSGGASREPLHKQRDFHHAGGSRRPWTANAGQRL